MNREEIQMKRTWRKKIGAVVALLAAVAVLGTGCGADAAGAVESRTRETRALGLLLSREDTFLSELKADIEAEAAAQIEAMKRARLAKAVATREEAVAAKEIIEGSTVEIAAKVSESGKLFGGISAEKIAIALSSKVEVNPKNITVEPIKTTGDFPATVALHPEITANFFVKVVAE